MIEECDQLTIRRKTLKKANKETYFPLKLENRWKLCTLLVLVVSILAYNVTDKISLPLRIVIRNLREKQRQLLLSPASFYKVDNLQDLLSERGDGPCVGLRSQVYTFPDEYCSPDSCVWSPRIRRNIDISRYPFNVLERPPRLQCPPPKGGQSWTSESIGIDGTTITLIISVKANIATALPSILQAFKVSREVDSSELIIVNDGSEDASLLKGLIKDLKILFDFRILLIENANSLGAKKELLNMFTHEWIRNS